MVSSVKSHAPPGTSQRLGMESWEARWMMRRRFWLSKTRAPAAMPSYSGWAARCSSTVIAKGERDGENVKEEAGAILLSGTPREWCGC